jgi:hypothetical protein
MDDHSIPTPQPKMADPSPTTTFSSLPSEIRLQILGDVAAQERSRWAFLATVSQEWQLFFEARTFRQLKLTYGPSRLHLACDEGKHALCLDAFDRVMQRNTMRRKFVQQISFEIRLHEYRTFDPEKDRFFAWCWDEWTKRIVNTGMLKLFRILGAWERGLTLERSLTLELNAFCASDMLLTGIQLFGSIDLSRLMRQNPQPVVHGITELVIRRELPRRLQHRSLRHLFRLLQSLERVAYETRRRIPSTDRELTDHQGTFSSRACCASPSSQLTCGF